ncbi:MAG: serine hydrolase domain-containing protein [Candidatus Nanopelagicales bacterium]
MIRIPSRPVAAILGLVMLSGVAACSSGSSTPATSASTAAPSAAASLTPAMETDLQKALDDVRKEFGAPRDPGRHLDRQRRVDRTSGVAKQGTSQQITPADHTRIGSITKTMTGTVILQLIDEKKLSFDDVIDTYVPGMPNGDTATIKNLLEMQSGIPTYTDDTSAVNTYTKDPTTAFTPQELVDSVKKKPAMFAPGEQFFYSNTNFVLLGMVIEKVTGKSIADNFNERLLTPLGMTQTSLPGKSTELPSPFLSGISEQADPLGTVKDATNWNPSFAFTAGEAISTLEDLHKWGVALGTGEGILPPETQQMRVDSVNTSVPPNTPERSYGMGIVNTAGWLGHVGDIPGYNTVLNYQPETHTTVVVMVNSDITKGPQSQPVSPAVAAFEAIAGILTPETSSASPSSSGN